MRIVLLISLAAITGLTNGCGKSEPPDNPVAKTEPALYTGSEETDQNGVPALPEPGKAYPPPPPMPVSEQFATVENLKIYTWHLRAWVAAGNELPEGLDAIMENPNCPKPLPAAPDYKLEYDDENVTVYLVRLR